MLSVWVEAGQDPASFWDQTPRTFAAVLEGCERRERRSYELATFQAWQAERMSREKRLKPVAKYVGELRPPKRQTPGEILANLREMNARGSPMTIRKVE